MTDDLSELWIHPVVVARYTGSAAYGDIFASGETVTGFVDDSRKLVRNAAGEEVVASASVFLPSATADVPADSKVTLPATFGGRTSRVVAVARHDSGDVGLPDHLAVHLL